MSDASVRLRPAQAQDRALMQRIYASTRQAELALTNWDEPAREAFVRMQFEAQEQHYLQHYPQSRCQVIVWQLAGQAQDVGRLWLDRRADALHVLDISLLQEARGHGIGTACLRRLLRQAHAAGLPLTIFVELHNPARRLYERLGLHAQGAPQGLYQHMACAPAQTHVRTTANEECLP